MPSLSLYSQIRVEEYLYPEYHLDSKVILEKNFDEPLLIQKNKNYRLEEINGKRIYSVFKDSWYLNILPGRISKIPEQWEIKCNITINSTQFANQEKINPALYEEAFTIYGESEDKLYFTFNASGHACVYYFNGSQYKIYKEVEFQKFNKNSEITIRKIDNDVFFYIDYFYLFDISVDLLKKHQGIDLSKISTFKLSISEGNSIELDNLVFTEYNTGLDKNVLNDGSIKITPNCFSLESVQSKALTKDFKDIHFKDITDKGRMNIVFAGRIDNLDDGKIKTFEYWQARMIAK